ncbi:MAG: ribosomal protein S18-alanine N-acetyltransferase [Alkalibacterium sp.]|nr:ribosomal protein S18-alanine N-acetyltransferase [Alkalibacterium sp.]TVP90858.1 MAG: ribosomal-protein-alanine N-acetyltransferase [Alkalibacterium sp.]
MTEKKLMIRAYVPEEELYRDFFELATQSFAHGSPWTLRQYADTLADTQLKFFVAETEDTIIGYAGGKVLLDEAEIYSVAVAPDFKNRQLATQLVRTFIEYCKSQGVEVMYLEVRQSNVPARNFYKKLGFKEVGKRPEYYRHPIEDAVLMKCTIGKLEHYEQ